MPQPWHTSTAVLDARVIMRHYIAAVEAIWTRLPAAVVALRPHPADDSGPVSLLRERFPRLEVDARPDVLEVLSECDLCVGGTSTAILQAGLVGTPAVLLNVTGYEWGWPLGGETSVAVARSQSELVEVLERWLETGCLPGRDDLLSALGADGGDATERLLRVLAGRAPAPTPTPVS